MSRDVSCAFCGKPMGVIRDASLRVKMEVACGPCTALAKEALRRAPPPEARARAQGFGASADFMEQFGSLFGGK